MTKEDREHVATRGDITSLERNILVLVGFIVAALTWYLTDLKAELSDEITSKESRLMREIDRVRSESLERHNDVREEMGKPRIEYDPIVSR